MIYNQIARRSIGLSVPSTWSGHIRRGTGCIRSRRYIPSVDMLPLRRAHSGAVSRSTHLVTEVPVQLLNTSRYSSPSLSNFGLGRYVEAPQAHQLVIEARAYNGLQRTIARAYIAAIVHTFMLLELAKYLE